MDKPTVIDLFAGAGGMSLGFRNAGYQVLFGNDFDPACKLTFEQNFPGVPYLLKDVKQVTPKQIFSLTGRKDIDVVVGGPACQGFSMANMRTRTADNPKNNLVFQFIRLVKGIKPSWFIMENVEGLLHMDSGAFTTTLKKTMEKAGYTAEFLPLCAADYGVPQKRNRVFFVGNNLGLKIVAPETQHTSDDDYVTVGAALSDLPTIESGTRGVTPCKYALSPQTEYQKKMRAKSKEVHNHIITLSNDEVLERYKRIPVGKNWSALPPGMMSRSVREAGGHSYLYRRLDPSQPANTIANFRKAMLIHPKEHRGLSVREAARLQSFDDSFIFSGGISSQQQQLANVVPPLLAQALATHIKSKIK